MGYYCVIKSGLDARAGIAAELSVENIGFQLIVEIASCAVQKLGLFEKPRARATDENVHSHYKSLTKRQFAVERRRDDLDDLFTGRQSATHKAVESESKAGGNFLIICSQIIVLLRTS